MRSLVLAAGLLSSLTVSAVAEDDRTAIDLPQEMRTVFLEQMRNHMTSLDSIIQFLSNGKIREAGAVARTQMSVGKGLGIGRSMPAEFREMAFDFQRTAGDFARLSADIPDSPDAAGWTKVMNGLAQITARCSACHATFRVR